MAHLSQYRWIFFSSQSSGGTTYPTILSMLLPYGAGLLLSFLLVFFGVSSAFAVHKGAGPLACGSCHTMHNSQGGSAASPDNLGGATGGSIVLLRGNVTSRAEVHKLCLQCHASNGSMANDVHPPQNVKAPKVWSTSAWTDDDPFNLIGSGGNFYNELDTNWNVTTQKSLGYGHSLGETNVTPPGGDTQISEFTCTNCHDPHGTADLNDTNINLFRNLKVNPTGAGANSGIKFYTGTTEYYRHKSYVGGVNGSYFGGNELDKANQVIWPVYRGTLTGNPVTDSANSNSYGTGTDTAGTTDGTVPATMSRWCAQCHDNWHEEIVPSNLDRSTDLDSRRHAVNSMMPRGAAAGCATGCHVSLLDRVNYNDALIQAGKALPVTASKFYSANSYYLPTDTTGASFNGMDDVSGGNNHKVFCLTCHFAHAGPYLDGLRWDYISTVSTGSQSANSIPSNKGCQLCHNR